jgi:hypothetical protein
MLLIFIYALSAGEVTEIYYTCCWLYEIRSLSPCNDTSRNKFQELLFHLILRT